MEQKDQGEDSSQQVALDSIAETFDCSRETLSRWVRNAEPDSGNWAGPTTDERQRVRDLERDNRELDPGRHRLRPLLDLLWSKPFCSPLLASPLHHLISQGERSVQPCAGARIRRKPTALPELIGAVSLQGGSDPEKRPLERLGRLELATLEWVW